MASAVCSVSREIGSPLLSPLDATGCEQLSGGRRQREGMQPRQGQGGPNALGRWTQISGGFYQINMAFNFIVGGNNNTISTMQGNAIDSINFKVLGLS